MELLTSACGGGELAEREVVGVDAVGYFDRQGAHLVLR
jgi:hypothetical protein